MHDLGTEVLASLLGELSIDPTVGLAAGRMCSLRSDHGKPHL
jgi:hypothetical protein